MHREHWIRTLMPTSDRAHGTVAARSQVQFALRPARIVAALLVAGFILPAEAGKPRRGPPPEPHALRDFAAQPYASTYRPLPRHDTLIRGATVLDAAGHRFDGADVLMRDGVIADIESAEEMIKHFIRKVNGKRSMFRYPEIVICG